MAKKIQLTRPELKRRRDDLARFERYLPMLKLKQQQLQLTLRDVEKKQHIVAELTLQAKAKFDAYKEILADVAGINVRELSKPQEIRTKTINIAGVRVPVFEGVEFPPASYSLFVTPAWVDDALSDLRDVSARQGEVDVLIEQYKLLHRELVKIIQRVNLFEKIKIPESRDAIRVIRIKLGDEMTAGVGRAKIAKLKIDQSEAEIYPSPNETDEPEAKAV